MKRPFDEIMQFAALIREAREAKSALGYIATNLEGANADVPAIAAYARQVAGRIHDVLEEPDGI